MEPIYQNILKTFLSLINKSCIWKLIMHNQKQNKLCSQLWQIVKLIIYRNTYDFETKR